MQADADPKEVTKFNSIARSYWDPEGPMRALHQMNPLRIDFTESFEPLRDADVLDVGCGGGLASEALAKRGANVTAIDASPEMLRVAQLHAAESQVDINYRQTTADVLAQTDAGRFDVVTCFEMIEHVPDPTSTLHALAQLVRPGGHLIVSTINRTPLAYLGAVVAAEYVLNWVPKGTHDYQRFLKPSEIAAMARPAALDVVAIEGVVFQPLYQQFKRSTRNLQINYQLAAKKMAND
jgi:2-polyprenyl-6-hydroxyphenyl methylase/3-demethylubiquinone-9 3-methyltransferase